MSRAVQQHMVAASWGRIVNLSSTSALGNRGQANYATAKAGLQGFTKTLAIELGKFGVTANCIAPGFIVSDMTKATAERILEYRQKNGSFKKVEDLMNVRGVGEKSFLKLKPLITVSPTKGESAGQ